MLKSYNELSRWYSALEPETTDVPARRDTAEQGASDEEPSTAHTASDDSSQSPPDTATDPASEAFAVSGHGDGEVVASTAQVVEPSGSHGGQTETVIPWADREVAERAGEPTAPEEKVDPFSLALDYEPIPTTDPRGRGIELPAVGQELTAERPDAVPTEYDKRPSPIEPEPAFAHPTDGKRPSSVEPEPDVAHSTDSKRPSPIEPEPPLAPPAELAARRRSDYTGGWSDWVAEPAPGPDDDYDAELVQFPWPEAVDDDYDDAHVLAPSGSLRPARTGQRVWVVLGVAVLVLALVATGVLFLLFGRGGDTVEPDDAALRFAVGNVMADTTGACPTERTATVVRSAEPGGTQSGPDAVLAFQHAYYVTRSGELARAVVAPDATVSPAAVIQRGIDSIPVGTTHCVRITTVAPGRFTVEVTEFRPAGAPATYTKQSVRTALVGDRTLITGIAAG
ncbi:hypothetical protein [Nocardia lasii]|uniref:DUF8176 domain-containing protein n=1 Tax=Nocardia lasii TaxID=1616107 RepID=A0ABW1JW88_9NOCA